MAYFGASQTGRGHLGPATELSRRSEQKAGTLRTHISMMIAVTGILWALLETESWLETIYGAELISYLILATVCIFVQYELRPRDIAEQSVGNHQGGNDAFSLIEKRIADGTYLKSRTVSFVQNALMVLTVLLIFTVFFTAYAGEFLFTSLGLENPSSSASAGSEAVSNQSE